MQSIKWSMRLLTNLACLKGVNLGPDTTARANGSVGGEITKRLVEMGQSQMSSSNNYNQSK